MTQSSAYKIPHIDSQALEVLYTSLTLGSVTQTAAKLGLSQPMVSIILKRMRLVFKDELLVRAGNRMVPTALGASLVPSLWAALDSLSKVFEANETFAPATSTVEWKIGCPDFIATIFLSEVVSIIHDEAPSCRVTIYPLSKDLQLSEALASGNLDIVIGNWIDPPDTLHMAPLLQDEIVCLMAQNNPLAKGMTEGEYFEAGHIIPLPFATAYQGVIDEYLSRMRLKRNVMVNVPYFSLAPHIAANTDLIFTTCRHFANFYANLIPLLVCQCPVNYPKMEFYLLWHARTHKDAGQKWLRSVLARASQKLSISSKSH